MIRQLWPYLMLSCFSCLHAQDVEDFNLSLSPSLSTASSSPAVPQTYIKPAWLTWEKLEEANSKSNNSEAKKSVMEEFVKVLALSETPLTSLNIKGFLKEKWQIFVPEGKGVQRDLPCLLVSLRNYYHKVKRVQQQGNILTCFDKDPFLHLYIKTLRSFKGESLQSLQPMGIYSSNASSSLLNEVNPLLPVTDLGNGESSSLRASSTSTSELSLEQLNPLEINHSSNTAPSLPSSSEKTYTWEDLKRLNDLPDSTEGNEFIAAYARAIAKAYRRDIPKYIDYKNFFLDNMGIKIPAGEKFNQLSFLRNLCYSVKNFINSELKKPNTSNDHPLTYPLHTYFKTVEELEAQDKLPENSVNARSSYTGSKRLLKTPSTSFVAFPVMPNANNISPQEGRNEVQPQETIPGLSYEEFIVDEENNTLEDPLPSFFSNNNSIKVSTPISVTDLVNEESSSVRASSASASELLPASLAPLKITPPSSSSFEKTYTWEDLKRLNDLPKSRERKEFIDAYARAIAKAYRRDIPKYIDYKNFFLDNMGIKMPERENFSSLSSLRGACNQIKQGIAKTLRDSLTSKKNSLADPLRTYFKRVEELEAQDRLPENPVSARSSYTGSKRPLESSTAQNSSAKKSRLTLSLTSSASELGYKEVAVEEKKQQIDAPLSSSFSNTTPASTNVLELFKNFDSAPSKTLDDQNGLWENELFELTYEDVYGENSDSSN